MTNRMSWWCRWGVHTWVKWTYYENPHYSRPVQTRHCELCGFREDRIT